MQYQVPGPLAQEDMNLAAASPWCSPLPHSTAFSLSETLLYWPTVLGQMGPAPVYRSKATSLWEMGENRA